MSRTSEVRVIAGAHPLSDRLRRDADQVDRLAQDVLDGQAPPLTLAGTLRMLAATLRSQRVPAAEGLEDYAARELEVRRG